MKIIVDIGMTLALLFLMGYQLWGDVAHEWVGAGMFVLFVAHQLLNWKWYKNLLKGHYTPIRVLQLIVDLLVFVTMLMLMYSGIVMSRYVFDFLPLNGGLSLARKLHILGSHWGLLLMSFHLGMHWNMLLGRMKKSIQIKDNAIKGTAKARTVVCFMAGLFIAIYGIFVFMKREFLTYLLLKTEFVFLDYNESIILFYLDYLALMGLCIFIAHYFSKLCRRFTRTFT